MSPKGRRQKPKQMKIEDRQSSSGLTLYVVLAIVLAGIPFCLGKYIEFNSPGAFDSGAYIYSAKNLLSGARLGVEEKPSANPATLAVNLVGVLLFGFNEVGPKTLQGIFQALALVMMFYTVWKLYGRSGGLVAVIIASVYLSAPVISKYGNVKEQFMIAFMVIGACCFVLYRLGGRRFWMILTGAALVNVYYFKPTGLSVVIALAVYMIVEVVSRRRSLRDFGNDLLRLMTGGYIGISPVLILYLWQGQLGLILKSLPALVLLFVLMIVALIAGIGLVLKYKLLCPLAQVNRLIWAGGAIAVSALLIPYLIYFAKTGDALSFLLEDVPFISYPLAFLDKVGEFFNPLGKHISGASSYVKFSREAVGFSEQAPRVFGYYRVLILPIVLASGSLVVGLLRLGMKMTGKLKEGAEGEKFILLFALWWLLDMAFVWVSPRSYEQYYLPLNASAAMLAGYLVWLYTRKLTTGINKGVWQIAGAAIVVFMVIMVWPIFAGLKKSPDTGMVYKTREDVAERRRGYAQSLEQVSLRRSGKLLYPWEALGEYIKEQSGPSDKIYVWGWFPGIYVKAQRLSSASKAFESDMHVVSPRVLRHRINPMVREFKKNPPKFIVDSRKVHFPNDRPPLELWPITQKGLLRSDEKTVATFEKMYEKMLAEKIDADQVNNYAGLTMWVAYSPWEKAMPEEAERFRVMKPLRDFVMQNYEAVPKQFGQHVLFKLKQNRSAAQSAGD